MQFLYYDKNVQKILEDPKLLQGKIGLEIGKNVKRRLNQLEATESFYYYLNYVKFGNPHPLHGNMEGCYALSVTPNYRLIVEPTSNNKDKKIYIKGVVDYHDGKYEWIIP